MTTMTMPSGLSLSDRVTLAGLRAATRSDTLAERARTAVTARRDDVRDNGAAPVLVAFIVLIAALLVLAAAISVAVLIFCSQKGMNFEWWVKTSWFEVKVVCSR